jgi:leucyl aminopeptidase
VGDRKWVHFDIAGTGRSEADAGENPKGGTGFGVRLLTTWISSL